MSPEPARVTPAEFIDRAIDRGQSVGPDALTTLERMVFLISEVEVYCTKDGIDSFIERYGKRGLVDAARAFSGVGASKVSACLVKLAQAHPEAPEALLERANSLVTGHVGWGYEAIHEAVAARLRGAEGKSADEYMAFLAAHQPMPSDAEIEDADGEVFAAALEHFEAYPDDRCIPLFINAVSEETGLGMYESIRFVLLRHPREVVLRHLEQALRSSDVGVLYRSCWWAADLGAWHLADRVERLASHPDADVRSSAAAFLEMCPGP